MDGELTALHPLRALRPYPCKQWTGIEQEFRTEDPDGCSGKGIRRMSQQKVFSREELEEMATPLVERIAAAIDGGEYEKAKALSRQLEQECVPMIYTFEDFVTALLSYIYENQGDEALQDSLRYAANAVMKPMHETLVGLGFREKVEVFAGFFRAHTGRGLSIEEDDEKVTLILDLCGSGGRMVREGHFGPPRNLLKVKKGQEITFGEEDFPSYCCHCAVFHHIMPIEWSGKPFPPIEVGSGPGSPCKWHFFKDSGKIPERFFEQVGKSKPFGDSSREG